MHVNIQKEEQLLCKLCFLLPSLLNLLKQSDVRRLVQVIFARIWLCPFMSDCLFSRRREGFIETEPINAYSTLKRINGWMHGFATYCRWRLRLSSCYIASLFFFFCHIALQSTVSVPQHVKTTGTTDLRFHSGCSQSCLDCPEMWKDCESILRCSQNATHGESWNLALLSININNVMIDNVTINVTEFIFSMLCRNIECRYICKCL